jgi:hypothetical protein
MYDFGAGPPTTKVEADLIHLYDDKPIAFSYGGALRLAQRRTMMKARLTLFLALLLLCTGAAYGLCNAYCEAMLCSELLEQAATDQGVTCVVLQ